MATSAYTVKDAMTVRQALMGTSTNTNTDTNSSWHTPASYSSRVYDTGFEYAELVGRISKQRVETAKVVPDRVPDYEHEYNTLWCAFELLLKSAHRFKDDLDRLPSWEALDAYFCVCGEKNPDCRENP